ncbi:MAG: cation:proton antiporter [Campylobacterota bacterium]|nr:cation:proton antiporter [Campylobacterota bacterium]
MLEIIIFTILISTILNLFLKQFGIPTIIGYIATGTVIAYGFDLHDAVHNHELKEIAEFGVVFLMFTIGLEFSVNHLMRMKKAVFFYGALQVVVTAAFFAFLANFVFGIEIKSSVIIGSALALSSTAIVLKLLNENGDINKVFGRKVLGVLLFQDIAVIPILLMITIFSVQDGSISDLLLMTFGKAILLLLGLFIAGKYLLEPFFNAVSRTKSNEIFISSILLIVIGASYVAHAFGFSYSLGAFIAGMMIAETHYKHQVEADLIPFRDLLLGIFFITVGMQLDFKIIFENIGIISILLPALIAIKIAIIYSIFRFKSTPRESLKTALSIFQLGEFALVIFELSFAQGLIDPVFGQVLIVIVVISMIITPFVLKNITPITDFFIRTKEKDNDFAPVQKEGLINHIVLIGYGRLGRHISKLIQKDGIEFVAIEGDIEIVKAAQKTNMPVIFGNASQKNILESINIKDASSVIISIGNSQKLNHICEVVNDLTHNTKTIVKVNRFEEKELLSKLNLSHVIVETENTALAMYNEALKC